MVVKYWFPHFSVLRVNCANLSLCYPLARRLQNGKSTKSNVVCGRTSCAHRSGATLTDAQKSNANCAFYSTTEAERNASQVSENNQRWYAPLDNGNGLQ